MSSKREEMRKRARRELAKREKKEEGDTEIQTEKEKTPSFMSGFFFILAGSFTFSIFFSMGQTLLGILAGAGFIILGMSRISKATAARSKEEKLSK